MRLLLDVHHSPVIADALRALGYDAVAAALDPVLAPADDEELLRAATHADRALVTENARDFDRIIRVWASRGEHHRGVIFTSARRFNRTRRSYPGDLIAALQSFLTNPATSGEDWIHWLP